MISLCLSIPRSHHYVKLRDTSVGPFYVEIMRIGSRILFDNEKGTVRYIGRIHSADGEWIGIELDEAIGRHDGQIQGVRYFSAQAQTGLFVRPDAIQKLSDSDSADARGGKYAEGTSFVGLRAESRSTSQAGSNRDVLPAPSRLSRPAAAPPLQPPKAFPAAQRAGHEPSTS